LRDGAAGQRLCATTLQLDQAFDGFSQPCCLGRRRDIHLSGVLLAIEFVGALGDNAVLAGDRGELLIKRGDFLGLLGLRQRFQIGFDVALRCRDGIADRREANDIRHHRRFDQQAGEKIDAGLDLQEPAQRVDRLVQRRVAARALVPRHQIEIGVVDGRRNRFLDVLVDPSDRAGQRAALRRYLDALGDRLIERVEPLDHRGARHVDLVVLAGVELAQPRDPRAQHLRLRGDIAGDLVAMIFVRRRHQPRR
jgi:hypothetical protein